MHRTLQQVFDSSVKRQAYRQNCRFQDIVCSKVPLHVLVPIGGQWSGWGRGRGRQGDSFCHMFLMAVVFHACTFLESISIHCASG